MSISSRYSISNINSNAYQTLIISGDTTLINNKIDGQGIIYAPYILSEATPIMDMGYGWQKYFLKKQRIEKLNKLKNLKK